MLLDVVDQAVGHPRDAAHVGHRLVDVAVLGIERGVAQQRELLVRIGDAALEPAGHPECAANADEHERQDDLACDFLHCSSSRRLETWKSLSAPESSHPATRGPTRSPQALARSCATEPYGNFLKYGTVSCSANASVQKPTATRPKLVNRGCWVLYCLMAILPIATLSISAIALRIVASSEAA